MDSLPSNADTQSRIVVLTFGHMEGSKGKYWCYVAVKPSEYDRFMAASKAGSLNINDFETQGFGEIVVSGEGLMPPTEITRKVAELFGTELKEMFADTDPKSTIKKKLEALSAKEGNTNT